MFCQVLSDKSSSYIVAPPQFYDLLYGTVKPDAKKMTKVTGKVRLVNLNA